MDPSALSGAADGLRLGVFTRSERTAQTAAVFGKYFNNKIRVVSCEQQGSFGASLQIAAKVDLSGMDLNSLVFYSYDKASNSYVRIMSPAYFVDANGYLPFYTGRGGDIVVSERPLEMK